MGMADGKKGEREMDNRQEMPIPDEKEEMIAKIKQLRAELGELRGFLGDSDGHSSFCGVNREGFEGCDEAMFSCDCGYEEAKRKITKRTQTTILMNILMQQQLAFNAPTECLEQCRDKPLVLDEIQYVQNLLPYTKLKIDKKRKNG